VDKNATYCIHYVIGKKNGLQGSQGKGLVRFAKRWPWLRLRFRPWFTLAGKVHMLSDSGSWLAKITCR
jgi:hypothetical protein